MELLSKEEWIFFAEETKKKKKQCLLSLPIILREKDRVLIKDMIENLIFIQKTKKLCDGFSLCFK